MKGYADEREIRQFQELMDGISKDPEQGMKRFYNEYGAFIQLTAEAYLHSELDTNDVVNSVLITVWEKSKKIKKIDNPKGWLCTVTTNRVKDLLKKRRHLPLTEKLITEEDVYQEIFEKDSFQCLVKDLPENEREIMVYRFVWLYTFQEIARLLDKPLPTITSLYYRGLKKIKAKLK